MGGHVPRIRRAYAGVHLVYPQMLLFLLLESGNPASLGIMIRDRRWKVY